MRWQTWATVLVLGSAAISAAEDWPQWLGPNQAAEWTETGLIESIPEAGLPVRWRVPVALGYSGPAVAAGKVYVFDYVKTSGEIQNNPGARTKLAGSERLQCFNTQDGSLMWKHEYDAPYEVSYAAGPRTTPTVDGDHVYTLGAEGALTCLSTRDGSVVWKKDLKAVYGVPSPLWGFSASPVVNGDQLYLLVGGQEHAVVALNKLTGAEEWRSLSDTDAGYSTPTLTEAGGVRQLIVWLPSAIHGLNPDNGQPYWSIDLKPSYGMTIMLPRVSGNTLFASGIGNVGAAMTLGQDMPRAEVAWRGKGNDAVYCSNSTPLIVDGVIYGCHCDTGMLTAVDLQSARRLWETTAPTAGDIRRPRHGTAYLVKQGDRFFLFSETGDLILAKMSREKYEELGRTHIIDPTNECFGRAVVWSHPAFAEQCVFARNDKELVCVELKGK
ncbi:MAG: PQQ-binding-like beta-propeller repeat protein [Planctomycetaceae bacterium]